MASHIIDHCITEFKFEVLSDFQNCYTEYEQFNDVTFKTSVLQITFLIQLLDNSHFCILYA